MSVLDFFREDPPPSGYYHVSADEAGEVLALAARCCMFEEALRRITEVRLSEDPDVSQYKAISDARFQMRELAREALVERGTEQTDTGDDPRSSVVEEVRDV